MTHSKGLRSAPDYKIIKKGKFKARKRDINPKRYIMNRIINFLKKHARQKSVCFNTLRTKLHQKLRGIKDLMINEVLEGLVSIGTVVRIPAKRTDYYRMPEQSSFAAA